MDETPDTMIRSSINYVAITVRRRNDRTTVVTEAVKVLSRNLVGKEGSLVN